MARNAKDEAATIVVTAQPASESGAAIGLPRIASALRETIIISASVSVLRARRRPNPVEQGHRRHRREREHGGNGERSEDDAIEEGRLARPQRQSCGKRVRLGDYVAVGRGDNGYCYGGRREKPDSKERLIEAAGQRTQCGRGIGGASNPT